MLQYFIIMLCIYCLPLHICRWREPSEANTFVLISPQSDDIYPLHHLLLRFYEWMCPSSPAKWFCLNLKTYDANHRQNLQQLTASIVDIINIYLMLHKVIIRAASISIKFHLFLLNFFKFIQPFATLFNCFDMCSNNVNLIIFNAILASLDIK